MTESWRKGEIRRTLRPLVEEWDGGWDILWMGRKVAILVE